MKYYEDMTLNLKLINRSILMIRKSQYGENKIENVS